MSTYITDLQTISNNLPANRNGLALQRRLQSAIAAFADSDIGSQSLTGSQVDHPVNDDERLPGFIGSFSKSLPHDENGQVIQSAYEALRKACTTGNEADFAAIPMGGAAKLANPQAGWSFPMMGADPFSFSMPAAPAFSSAETAGEMVEMYWHALLRDVHFSDYTSSALVASASADLSLLSDFKGPKSGGLVTPENIFRYDAPGCLTGPYISQFLFKTIPTGLGTNTQTYPVPAAGTDYMTTETEWLAVQNGAARSGPPVSGAIYLRNGRDLGEYVHRDFSYQAFLDAALILLGANTPRNPSNPYARKLSEAPFVTFGPPNILDDVTRIALEGLRAAWTQKWAFHRRLRPEVFGQRVHRRRIGAANHPIHPDVFKSEVLDRIYSAHGTYLLPMAFPEGSPTHPAYPAGHGTISGACVTILKAFFDENATVSSPVVASSDGLSLVSYTGGTLTVGGELNKLAVNISIGRNFPGVHYRSDSIEGMLLGEKVAIEYLRSARLTFNETFAGTTFTKFDGTQVTV